VNFDSRGVTAGHYFRDVRIDSLVPRGAPSEAQWAVGIGCRGSVGQLELAAAVSRKAVWWDLRFASLLTNLLVFCWLVT